MTKIVTYHYGPDEWESWYDADGKRGYYGSGKTERAAIDDLMRNYPLPEAAERMRVALQLIASLPVHPDAVINTASLYIAVNAAKEAIAP